MSDKELIAFLQAENRTQGEQIKSLEGKINLLEDKLKLMLEALQAKGVKKDSHNSSMPPSSDLPPKPKSLRPPSLLKSGGQPGHKGSTMEMVSMPDKIIELKSSFCSRCGEPLSHLPYSLTAKRQVVELPPVAPIYEEYRQYVCQCPACHHQQAACFPPGVEAPIQYGPSVEAMVCYYSVYQYIPFARLQSLMAQAFSLHLSQGSVDNILKRAAVKCGGVYNAIKEQIAKSPVVGSDETGAKVNGTKWWVWVWQNVLNTFIVASDNRGSATIAQIWGDMLSGVAMVSDRWVAQLKTKARWHQLCLAHLLRDLIFLEETEKHDFATQFRKLLLDVFALRKVMVEQGPDGMAVVSIEERLNHLLLMHIDKEKAKTTATFQLSMLKYRDCLLPCLYDLRIPPDNNGSERAIRNIKVKQKVSGQFKSGQDAFCVIRSIIDTLLKRRVEVLPSLIQICRLQPE